MKRTFRWSTWLGWQLESNWTDPKLFVLYVIIKPLTGSLLLVCMYYAARMASTTPTNPQGLVPQAFLPWIYVGSACYGLVGAVMFGMSYAVISDREHYRMLKYIFISPAAFRTFFVGRGLSGGLQALVGGLINLTVGIIIFPEIRYAFHGFSSDWPWLFVYLPLGAALLTILGLILAGTVLNMARQGMFVSEGIAGIMYLACGVVFPMSILPEWLRVIGMILPPTYWLEGVRRSLLGNPSEAMLQSSLNSWTHPQLVLALLASTVLLGVFQHYFFGWSERRAWRLGRIEETTGA